MIDQKIISKCANVFDSFYVYDEHTILQSINELKETFPQIDFLYSIKCNPNANVLKSVFSQNFGADAASAREVKLACNLGLTASQIFYSAPGKSIIDIENTINKSMIIADSLTEIKRIQSVAEALNIVVKIGIRVNPNFSHSGETGLSSKFGIDEDQAIEFIKLNNFKNIKIVGIHVHLKSQLLNAEVLVAYYKRLLNLAEKFSNILGALEYINMGSGMGIQYSPTDKALDVLSLSKSISNSFDDFRSKNPKTKMIIEVGRYVTCKSGFYVTRVMDKKVLCGKTYLILKNTLNGFIRPSLAKLVEHYSLEKSPSGSEPLFTCKNAFEIIPLKKLSDTEKVSFEIIPLKKSSDTEKVSLVGNLCTATDVVAEDIILPTLECGDLIVLTNAGSYAAVLSPMQFSSQDKPLEFFLSETGKLLVDYD